jgi:predicted CXXCH cytochrome family protein
MVRPKDTKQIAGQIDPTYVRRGDPRIRLIRLVTVVVVAAAVIWFVFSGLPYFSAPRDEKGARPTFLTGILNSAIYNPGPLTAAHMNIQQNCSECHVGDGKGGFSRAVSDDACTKCHAACIHNQNQKSFVVRIPPNDPKGIAVRSSDCTKCHVEHKGQAALLSSDAHCLQCHADLTKERWNKSLAVVANSVTAFTLSEHPGFGRTLLAIGNGTHLADGTNLKFSHKDHLEMGQIAGDCSACHHMNVQWASGSQAPVFLDSTGRRDRRYFLPVSYERDCKTCHEHQLLIPGDPSPPLAHRDMELVRAQLADARGLYARYSSQLTGDDAQNLPSPDDWLKSLEGKIDGAFDQDKKTKNAFDALDKSKKATSDDATNKPPPPLTDLEANKLEFMMAYTQGTSSCSECHYMQGKVPIMALPQPSDDSGSADSGVTTTPPAVTLLSTLPTGIVSTAPPSIAATQPSEVVQTPRRWFVNSQFDHDAHRNLSCVQCHAQALSSEDMSTAMLPTMQECVKCHHAPDPTGLGAGAACATCHVYHNRADDIWTGSTTQPAAEPTASAQSPAH